MKPKSSLVRIIFEKIRQQDSNRPGFLSECQNLCELHCLDFESIINFDEESSLPEFGAQLKSVLYTRSFQNDLAAVRKSNQASILASLFPPQSSYYSYRPLDLAVRVLHREIRAVRTSFFQNLVGSSKLSNCIDRTCKLCKAKLENIGHYFFNCTSIRAVRNKFMNNMGKLLEKTNPHVAELWQNCLRNIQADSSMKTACAVLFGGNYAVNSEGEWNLFRKTHYKTFHESDRTCIATAQYLEKLGQLLDRQSNTSDSR